MDVSAVLEAFEGLVGTVGLRLIHEPHRENFRSHPCVPSIRLLTIFFPGENREGEKGEGDSNVFYDPTSEVAYHRSSHIRTQLCY